MWKNVWFSPCIFILNSCLCDITHSYDQTTSKNGHSMFDGGSSTFLPPTNPQSKFLTNVTRVALRTKWALKNPRLIHRYFPNHSVYIQLQPARDDGGCVICQGVDDNPANQIVLCDHCDRGFHQLCYSPVIDNTYVEIKEQEFICHACSVPLSTTSSQGLSTFTEDMSLTGQQLSPEVKESYLRNMSRAGLVQLITRIEASAPSFKLYPSRLSSPTAMQSDEMRFMSATPTDSLMGPSRRESITQEMNDGLGSQMKSYGKLNWFQEEYTSYLKYDRVAFINSLT